MKLKTKDLALIALSAALIAICAWISIPMAVPFTMQTFGVFMAIGLLGGRRGTIAVSVYILLGAFGLPVFAGFRGGLGVLLGTTGGYITGFIAAALVMWVVLRCFGNGKWTLAVAMAAGLLVCYAFGTAWFVLVYTKGTGPIGIAGALSMCVFPFLLPDVVKLALAYSLCLRLKKHSLFARLET